MNTMWILAAGAAWALALILPPPAFCEPRVAAAESEMLAVSAASDGGGHEDSRQSMRTELRIVVDLSKKETVLDIPTIGGSRQTCVAEIEVSGLPTAHRLDPKSDTVRLGHPVAIVLAKPPGVKIWLSLMKRKTGLVLKVTPRIELARGGSIDFTLDRIKRTGRSFAKRVRDFSRQLVACRQERQRIDIWLLSPGNKPLQAAKQARMALEVLDRQIKAAQRALPLAQSQYAILRQVAVLATQIHKKTEIRCVVRAIGSEDQ